MFRYPLTEDAELRLLEPRHAEELYALVDQNREHLLRWEPFPDYTHSPDDLRGFIAKGLHRFAEDGSLLCGIWHHGALAGCIDVLGIDWNARKTALGYWVGEAFQGKGLVTTATRAIVSHLFAIGVNRVEITAIPENHRSRAVAERLGFQLEGMLRQVGRLRDSYTDRALYAMLREDWHGEAKAITFAAPLHDDAELRLLMPHYAEEIFALVEDNRQHLCWMTFTEGTRSVEDIRNFIRHTLQEMAEGKGLSVAIAQQGRLAGIFGAGGIKRNSQKVEIGYWLAEEFQGKGLMTRAGRKMLAHLFETEDLNRIEVRCDVRNTRSRALAERLGFVYEGTKRQADKIGGEFVDMHYFGLLQEDWEAKQCQ